MNTDATAACAKGLRGPLIQPADADCNAARAFDNGMNRQPALVARGDVNFMMDDEAD